MILEKYFTRYKISTITVENTFIKSLKKQDITKTAVRAYDGKRIGISAAMGSYDESNLAREAEKALKKNIPYPYKPCAGRRESFSHTPQIIKDEELISEAEELLSEMRARQPLFSFSHEISVIEFETGISNNAGLDLYFKNRIFDLGFLIRDKKSANIMDSFVSVKGKIYDRAEVLKEIDRNCDAFGRKMKLNKKGRQPVVFLSDDALIYSKLTSELNGTKIGTKSSLFNNLLGKKSFSGDLTFMQSCDPYIDQTSFFDAEGAVNPGYACNFIENGFILKPFADKKNAAEYNLEHTASAQCDYDEVPRIGLSSARFKSSAKTIKELLGGRKAILAYICSGGDFTPDGDFSTPVQLAYYFDGTDYIGRLPQIQLKSNIFDMFGGGFIGASEDKVCPLTSCAYIAMDMDVSLM